MPPMKDRSGLKDPCYSDEETEVLRAVDRYRREAKRPFPSVTELLALLRAMGYRRVDESRLEEFLSDRKSTPSHPA